MTAIVSGPVVSRPIVSGKMRAYLEFVAAVLFYFLARVMAHRSVSGVASDAWATLAEQGFLLLLVVVGFAAFGLIFDHQKHPIAEQGLPVRHGWRSEAGLGVVVGWSAAVVCILPLTLFGGIAIVLSTHRSAWGWLVVDGIFFALAAMVEEVAFRGYAFQRFIGAIGPFGATLGFAAFYAALQALLPGSSYLSILIAALFSVLMSTAYLRTRALWVSWGLNFGWKASRALFFGLAVSGVSSHSSVIEGDPMGPFWLTGGGFGLDGSWIAFFVLLAAFPVVYRITRDLDYRYNAPLIVPAGVAVDLDASARRQHEAAMGPAEPSAPRADSGLVQILPAVTDPLPVASNGAEKLPDDAP
jgi:membrane protease YdiL (CAAX protease family)